jgi:uncharacterized protein (TIGR02284 family)
MNDALTILSGMTATDATIDHFNSFLRGELSAVETYRQALEKIHDNMLSTTMRECLASHQQRVTLLTEAIRRLGGEPAKSSGAWGAFAKLVEGGAKAFGERAAIAALEEGEDHGLNDYKRDLDDLDASAKKFVEMFLLPDQRRTHDAMSQLKRLH